MNVTQCDNCRALGPVPPIGWLILARVNAAQTSLFGPPPLETEAMFCTIRCAAEYTTAKALIGETSG